MTVGHSIRPRLKTDIREKLNAMIEVKTTSQQCTACQEQQDKKSMLENSAPNYFLVQAGYLNNTCSFLWSVALSGKPWVLWIKLFRI